MDYTNLAISPEYVKETVKLIEKEFGYDESHSFAVDFYPLMNQKNHHQCFIAIENKKVIAHLGVLIRKIPFNNGSLSIAMYGGIAVDQSMQGRGVFKKLFNHVLSQYKEIGLHLLWSEKTELYRKFNFIPAIEMNEYLPQQTKHSFKVLRSSIKEIDEAQLNTIKNLYNQNDELRIKRDDEHWSDLKKIESTDLYLIYNGNELINYFLMNKGADLTGIIHEYGHINEEQLSLFQNYGSIWTTFQSNHKNYKTLLASIIKVGNLKYFSEFCFNEFNIKINEIKEDIILFEFNNESFNLKMEEFLLGLFGPGRFEDFKSFRKLYICGVDSI